MNFFDWRWKGAVFAATCFVLAGCAPQEIVYTPRPAVLPLDIRGDDRGHVYKWVRPLTVSLVGTTASDYRASVNEQLETLRTITGHDLALVDGADADVWLIFGAPTPKAALASHAEIFAPLYSSEAAMTADLDDQPADDNAACRSKWGTSVQAPHEIVYAVGQVTLEFERNLTERCILRLLVTALGGAEPETEPLGTGEVKGTEEEARTEAAADILLLTVWYDRRVKPGMTVDEIKPIMAEKMQLLLEIDQQRRTR